jgi:hypothetical protein
MVAVEEDGRFIEATKAAADAHDASAVSVDVLPVARWNRALDKPRPPELLLSLLGIKNLSAASWRRS